MEVKKQMIIQKFQKILSSQASEKIIFMTISFFISLLMTRGLAFGKYAPFAIAFASAVPKMGLPSAIIGGILGYLLPSPVYLPFRYIASLLCVMVVRWSFSELKKLNKNQFFAPAISFLPLLGTGIAMSLLNNSMPSIASLYVAEAFMAGGASYFFSRSCQIILSKKVKIGYDYIDIACLAISIGVLILSFNEITIYSVSLGRILMVLMVLLCANSGGIAGGSIAGVTAGAIGGLSGLGVSYLSGAYGLGGLMSGVFSYAGKALGAIAFIIAHGVASLQIGDSTGTIVASIEVAIATIVYMFLPRSQKLSELFGVKKDNISGNSLRNSMIMRLTHSSKALLSVSTSVDEISEKLSKTQNIKPSYIFNQATAEVCSACGLRAICWTKNKNHSVQSLSSLLPILQANNMITEEDFEQKFRTSCSRFPEMKNSINKFYKRYVERQQAEIRASSIRDISCEQFKVTSAMLSDMANEISLYENFDEETASKVAEVLRKLEIYPTEVCCMVDKNSRMTIEAEVEKRKDQKLNKAVLVKEVSRACGVLFSPPCISNTKYTYKIKMCQKPLLDVVACVAQESASALCGDCAVSFYDGQGNYIAIISDGMGTGGMAAVDGAMASSMMENLLKAGIGYDTALRMVNSALMTKCEQETLATMDITSIDLHTGQCEFRKAGAALTLVKKGKKVIPIEENSLPVGIMPEVKFCLSIEELKKGDIVVMVSDGVTTLGTDWLKSIIEKFDGIEPNELANEIVLEAKKSSQHGHMDDITALVMMINSKDSMFGF